MKKYKTKKQHSKPFIMLNCEIWESATWKKFQNTSKIIYMFFRKKTYGALANAKDTIISASYDEIRKETGCALSTIQKGIIELENLGFIDFVEQGGLKSGGFGKNKYKPSIRFLKYGMPDFQKGKLKKECGITYKGFGLHKKWRHQKGNESATNNQSEAIKNITGPTDFHNGSDTSLL